MPSDSMDDIELKNIQLQFPSARTLSRDDSSVFEERVETGTGSILVAVQGNRAKPAILTYHDLGLNCEYKQLPLIEETGGCCLRWEFDECVPT
jgi:hypothetical protein